MLSYIIQELLILLSRLLFPVMTCVVMQLQKYTLGQEDHNISIVTTQNHVTAVIQCSNNYGNQLSSSVIDRNPLNK